MKNNILKYTVISMTLLTPLSIAFANENHDIPSISRTIENIHFDNKPMNIEGYHASLNNVSLIVNYRSKGTNDKINKMSEESENTNELNNRMEFVLVDELCSHPNIKRAIEDPKFKFTAEFSVEGHRDYMTRELDPMSCEDVINSYDIYDHHHHHDFNGGGDNHPIFPHGLPDDMPAEIHPDHKTESSTKRTESSINHTEHREHNHKAVKHKK